MKYIILGLLLVLTGCATGPTQEQLNNADYGIYPTEYESIIKSYMSMRLKDPTSAIYSFSGIPHSMWAGGGLTGPVKFGYGVCAHINAKNSFGGYVGNQQYFFLIKNGQVVLDQEVQVMAKNPCY